MWFPLCRRVFCYTRREIAGEARLHDCDVGRRWARVRKKTRREARASMPMSRHRREIDEEVDAACPADSPGGLKSTMIRTPVGTGALGVVHLSSWSGLR